MNFFFSKFDLLSSNSTQFGKSRGGRPDPLVRKRRRRILMEDRFQASLARWKGSRPFHPAFVGLNFGVYIIGALDFCGVVGWMIGLS